MPHMETGTHVRATPHKVPVTKCFVLNRYHLSPKTFKMGPDAEKQGMI